MVWSTTITEVLNSWNQQGVFSYVIPFLLIFALVYGILVRTQIFKDNKGVNAIIAVAVGLLAIQFDFVATFYAVIFPRFGVGLSIFLVLILSIGFFYPGEATGKLKIIGIIVGAGVVLWSLMSWGWWGDNFGVGDWFIQNLWALAVLGVLIGGIVLVTKDKK